MVGIGLSIEGVMPLGIAPLTDRVRDASIAARAGPFIEF
jgi:hypothetical protein